MLARLADNLPIGPQRSYGSIIRATGVVGFLACLVCPRPAAAQWQSVWHATIAPSHEIGRPESVPWVDVWKFEGGSDWRQGPVGIGVDLSGLYFPPLTERFGAHSITVPATSLSPIVTVLGAFHFGQPGRPHPIEPFANIGLGVPIAGLAFILDVGGGVDWWLTSRVGIRAAARDQIMVELTPGVIGFEAGLVFR